MLVNHPYEVVLPKIKPPIYKTYRGQKLKTYGNASANYKGWETLQEKPPNFFNKILQLKIKDVGEDGGVESKERLKRQILNHNVRNSFGYWLKQIVKNAFMRQLEI